MAKYRTEQEAFWAGEFGDCYIGRNESAKIVAGNTYLFSRIIKNTRQVRSVIEFGSNIGLNLRAIKAILPSVELSAIEINGQAAAELQKIEDLKIYHTSIFDFVPDYERDLVLIKGVLIHLNPDMLPTVYDLLYRTCKRYICVAEYYNPVPVSVPYRGHNDKLFKRDFAGELLERHKGLELVDYGFVYHRDENFPQDDITWFLLQKKE